MKYTVLALLAGFVTAAPVVERTTTPNDDQILNYALTLEHLEATFYAEALQKLTSKDFEAINLSPLFYQNLKEIAYDEKTHVSFLTSALEANHATPVAACTYKFGYTDAKSFLATAALLEGVGLSAYLGAASSIVDKTYLTAAGAILTVEARHSAYLRRSQRPKAQSPFPAPFDIPLEFDEVFSLASLFITSCPSSNPALPFKAFPAVSVSPATEIKCGQVITLTAAKSVAATHAYFITVTGPVAATLSGSGTSYKLTVPSGVPAGQNYVVLTCDAAAPSDDNIVAGPAVVPIADNIIVLPQ